MVSERARVTNLPLGQIRASRRNPRKRFDQEDLAELAASIREVGVIQPIIVVPAGDKFRIVAGERRFRAAKQAGLKRIPAVVRVLSKVEMAKIAFIENLQRRDLDPIEEAHAIQDLMKNMDARVEDVARIVGKSVSYVYSRLRLLDLPEVVRQEVAAGRLAPATAAVLSRLKDPTEIQSVALRAVREQLALAQVEGLVKERIHRSARAGRSDARTGAFNRKLKVLKAANGKPIVAYNEFDSTQHQRVWNLRFPECGKCPKKGILLSRDLRQEDLCVDPICYQTLETRERNERFEIQAQSREGLRRELQRILARNEVEAQHLQILAFTMLEVVGAVADAWRMDRALLTHGDAGAAEAAWQWMSGASLDDLITAAIEFSVMLLVSGAGHDVRVPGIMVDDLSTDFGLDRQVVSALTSTIEVHDETGDVAPAHVT